MTSQWSSSIQSIKHLMFRVCVGENQGTGFIVDIAGENMLFATAWHVISEFEDYTDKHARYVELYSTVGDFVIRANAVGIARFGYKENDIGLMWIGNPLKQQWVDRILQSWAEVGTSVAGGHLDLSGGGGYVEVSGSREPSKQNRSYKFRAKTEATVGMELGWLGYPSCLETGELCFHKGTLSTVCKDYNNYLIDGADVMGMSGGPVFDIEGGIVGIIGGRVYDPDTYCGWVKVAAISDVRETFILK